MQPADVSSLRYKWNGDSIDYSSIRIVKLKIFKKKLTKKERQKLFKVEFISCRKHFLL